MTAMVRAVTKGLVEDRRHVYALAPLGIAVHTAAAMMIARIYPSFVIRLLTNV
jgi:hypothetical protein